MCKSNQIKKADIFQKEKGHKTKLEPGFFLKLRTNKEIVSL